MSKPEHTPGPWTVEERVTDDLIGGGRSWYIGEADAPSIVFANEADAKLIAAAPELLEHLEALMATEARGCPDWRECEVHEPLWAPIYAAIAKAKGEQP